MTSEDATTVEIWQSIPARMAGGTIGGQNYIDDQGRWAVRLSPSDEGGVRYIHLREGDTFEWTGGTWEVTKVYEPREGGRPHVATLTKVS